MIDPDQFTVEAVEHYLDALAGEDDAEAVARAVATWLHERTDDGAIKAFQPWRSNGHLVAGLAQMGVLADVPTLDPTYGYGGFWTQWRPTDLIAHDFDPAKSPTGRSIDACSMPYVDGRFPQVVIDGPYKLNGTPDDEVDEPYGVHVPATPKERMELMTMMMEEGVRVLAPRGTLLFKCMNQVVSGRKVWQTDVFTDLAASLGLRKLDEIHYPSYRPQPKGRTQKHVRSNFSTMLIFRNRKTR